MESLLEWREPPERSRTGRHALQWAAWATGLRRQPMAWAALRKFDGRYSAFRIAQMQRNGKYSEVPVEEFELRGVLQDAGGSELFARYIGYSDGAERHHG